MKTTFHPSASPVTDALILICEKCGKKVVADPEENPAKFLQQTLKETIRARYGKGKFRSVITSCMDVCPKGELTVGILPVGKNGEDAAFHTFEPGNAKEQAAAILELAENLSDPRAPPAL